MNVNVAGMFTTPPDFMSKHYLPIESCFSLHMAVLSIESFNLAKIKLDSD